MKSIFATYVLDFAADFSRCSWFQ